MKYTVIIIFIFCIANSSAGIKKKKYGFLADKCILLSTGDVFWPSDWRTECNAIPICLSGYTLHKTMLGNLRACCCQLKRVELCPDCDMTKTRSFYEWINLNMSRNGPPDGKCENGKLKRIFFGGPNQLDKCCCEARNSPFMFKYLAK